MAFGLDVNNYADESEYMYMLAVEDIIDAPHQDETLIVKKLPPGTWQIVCTSKEATEEQLTDLVRELPIGQRFANYSGDYPVWYHSRKESLRSLLTSKGCDLNKHWLILKKQ